MLSTDSLVDDHLTFILLTLMCDSGVILYLRRNTCYSFFSGKSWLTSKNGL